MVAEANPARCFTTRELPRVRQRRRSQPV